VYTARRESLAKLEALVHLKPAIAPRLVLVDATIPDAFVATLRGALPPGWDDVPDSGAARSIGDSWLQRSSSPALEVPSVHSSSETNVLINPAHPDFAQLVIGTPVPFAFDRRLIDPYQSASNSTWPPVGSILIWTAAEPWPTMALPIVTSSSSAVWGPGPRRAGSKAAS